MKNLALGTNNDIDKENTGIIMEPDDLIIKCFSPLGFTVNKSDMIGTMGTLSLLCISKSNKMFTMSTNYLIESDDETEVLKESLEFHDESSFVSTKFVNNLILTHIDSFITDFKFTFNKDIVNDEKFDFDAKYVNQKEGLQNSIYRFSVTSDVYVSMKFIDQYINNCLINKHYMGSATVHGYYTKEEPTEIIIADRIDRIVALAPLSDDRKNTNYAIEFIVKDKDSNSNTILCTFNLSQTFNKKKFKGMTVDKLDKNYLAEDDQYLQDFLTFDKLNNIDKEYLIILGKNKDNKSKIFFLDSTLRTELESLVGDY